jgi:hypothetical protein
MAINAGHLHKSQKVSNLDGGSKKCTQNANPTTRKSVTCLVTQLYL